MIINEGMTETSGIGDNGLVVTIGVEAMFYTQSDPFNTARIAAELVSPTKTLNIHGSVAARPPDPKVSGGLFSFKVDPQTSDFLVRIHAARSTTPPTQISDLELDPTPIFNVILKTMFDAANLIVPLSPLPWPGPDWKWIVVDFGQAGKSTPANCELQLTGIWV